MRKSLEQANEQTFSDQRKSQRENCFLIENKLVLSADFFFLNYFSKMWFCSAQTLIGAHSADFFGNVGRCCLRIDNRVRTSWPFECCMHNIPLVADVDPNRKNPTVCASFSLSTRSQIISSSPVRGCKTWASQAWIQQQVEVTRLETRFWTVWASTAACTTWSGSSLSPTTNTIEITLRLVCFFVGFSFRKRELTHLFSDWGVHLP